MKMYARNECGIMRKPLDSLRQMMHVALVFPTDITGRVIVADVEELSHYHQLPTFNKTNIGIYRYILHIRVRS